MPTAGDLFQALVRKIGRKKLRRNFFRIFLWGLNPKTDYNPLHSISTPSQTLKKHSQPVLKKLVSLDSTIVSSLSGLVGLVSVSAFQAFILRPVKRGPDFCLFGRHLSIKDPDHVSGITLTPISFVFAPVSVHFACKFPLELHCKTRKKGLARKAAVTPVGYLSAF